ncbi:serine hydrolase [Nocardia terpenica]|uniref:Serine hydrolase n=2 Tax=Nocardia terpenica TaxID=455432 RepID=A0A6G9ZE26_9NOCA|nr:serine hydrolase [Nocardia terpenica]
MAVTMTLLTGACYAVTALSDIPAPPTLAQLLWTPPSRQGELFPSRTVAASADPIPLLTRNLPLPDTVPWKGKPVPVEQFADITRTNALLVLRDGALAHEWYRDGFGASTRLSSWSTAKSVVSLLIGQAIDAGKLREDDRVVEVLPHLATGGDYDTITVRDLLDMSSGVDVPENYDAYDPLTGTAGMFLTRDLPGFVRDHRDLQYRPGSQATYRSVDTELLGLILAEVEGKPLSELLARNLWGPIGAQDDATWNLDREGGTEKAFCCLNATARDYAKIGLLVLHQGQAGDRQVVPARWITRIATPARQAVDGWGYSAQWWHPSADGRDFSALGVYGQYIYVDPDTETVIVKLSDYGDQQDEQETFDALRAIARTTTPKER